MSDLTWKCETCGLVHPIEHEGMFCGMCMTMVACMSCERDNKHACAPKVLDKMRFHIGEGATVAERAYRRGWNDAITNAVRWFRGEINIR